MRKTFMFIALAMAGASALAADTGTLTVHATGFTHARGHAVAKLLAPGDELAGPGRGMLRAEIHEGAATLSWPALPHGRYAVVVFHDENDNGTLDHNWLRLPAEPMGFSNGFELSFHSGMPSFDKLRFDFTQPEQTLEVRIQ